VTVPTLRLSCPTLVPRHATEDADRLGVDPAVRRVAAGRAGGWTGLASQATLRSLLLQAKRDGAGVVFSTHQLAFAISLADRLLVLDDGRVVDQ
jgi:hypothetical protein